MPDQNIDLGTLPQELGENREIRDAIKARYDAIIEEAKEAGHDLLAIHGDPQGMNLRIGRPTGFPYKDQALAEARGAGWNAELNGLSHQYALAAEDGRAIEAEIAEREKGGKK